MSCEPYIERWSKSERATEVEEPVSPFQGGGFYAILATMGDIAPVPQVAPKCGALKTDGSGDRCKMPAGYGTTHPGYGPCKFHFGSTPSMVRHASRQQIRHEAIKVCEARGVDPAKVRPEQVMLEELARSYATVNYLESETSPEAAMWPEWQSALLAERKHQVAVAKMVLDAGIDERRTRIMEDQAEVLGSAVREILDQLGLSEDQRARAPQVVRQVMAELPAA